MTLKHKPADYLLRGTLIYLLIGLIVACNKKDDEPTVESTYVSTESVAITSFSLTADVRVMQNLDSVFFSIDLEHGVIFNADSLPKGTNVTKLIPKIKYPSTVTAAEIEMTGGTHREGKVNYFSNSSDTIDFTGKVFLTLKAGENIEKTYRLKVNVHQQDPDTIYWDRLASMDLPSRLPDPKDQKTVAYGSGVISLIEESDGSYTLSSTSDIFEANWQKAEFTPGFAPVLRTLTAATDGTLYMLDDNGGLHSAAGTDASWTDCDSGWNEIIGFYNGTLLGTAAPASSGTMKSYPDSEYNGLRLPADFPVTGFTRAIEFTNRWTPNSTIVIFGGYPFPADGRCPSWAFDGSQWVNIAENTMPALTGMSVMKYYSYLKSASSSLLKEFDVYLAFGGMDKDGIVNNTLYVSYDYGINWQKAQTYMQLPASVFAGTQVDAIPLGMSMESNLSNRWKSTSLKRRLPFEIDGDLIKWNCPYIFLFGGMDASYTLQTRIRSGVLQRLSFEPLF